ncbi:hypothetical protein [Fimbriiglobus ruber]|uniref:Uncharacterized protein n=1 Tax=Fimbriiglobus ruber TaxID=1908690 RepID=A0A225D3V2_9BACT|nr:hypothetical protein [Fimbriiglobus ruber]OWK34314.1 hypothetical protein FRUB_10285 [Fimbriiglobus ruber]
MTTEVNVTLTEQFYHAIEDRRRDCWQRYNRARLSDAIIARYWQDRHERCQVALEYLQGRFERSH